MITHVQLFPNYCYHAFPADFILLLSTFLLTMESMDNTLIKEADRSAVSNAIVQAAGINVTVVYETFSDYQPFLSGTIWNVSLSTGSISMRPLCVWGTVYPTSFLTFP